MLVTRADGEYYKIENAQKMQPFFINVVSSSDVWMYLSSNGGLTAGRQNPAVCIFPYETDDRLHQAASTGPKTLIKLPGGRIWEPFNAGADNPFDFTRNLYKRAGGDAIVFEEINHDAGLVFSYRWETSEKYGIVRTSILTYSPDAGGGKEKHSQDKGHAETIKVSVLDGVENIMPYGIPAYLAQTTSCLTDAYKACERHGKRLAVYSLTSLITDNPEPVEVLRANVAWHIGQAGGMLLSSKQIPDFAQGRNLTAEELNEENPAGRKGAFMLYKEIALTKDEPLEWIIVMDAGLSQSAVVKLAQEVNNNDTETLRSLVKDDIRKGSDELERIVAAADGIQLTADRNCCIRHYMNVLNNNMRGGVFLDGYNYKPGLLQGFFKARNKELTEGSKEFKEFINRTRDIKDIAGLYTLAWETDNADIIRLCMEFLPLTFSRRHGDPSRPWNYFNIRVKDEKGNRVYGFEGNWRDIFQNWEAMLLSFPGYMAAVITKFFNASTIDGYNPYRLTNDGIDWEIPEPDNPWSGYGYWGDHQIVYLNRLIEWLLQYNPDDLDKLMSSEIYTFSDVPYEIVPYADIVKNSKDTIFFNGKKHAEVIARADEIGADGKLLRCDDGIAYASFFEKLLIPVLAKLSNLVPDGGIWMNTNRPEWNDANNAIVGNGLSMVTVYQLYRHLGCCRRLAARYKIMPEECGNTVAMSKAAGTWLCEITCALRTSAGNAREYLDKAGEAFGKYRNKVYAGEFTERTTVNIDELDDLLKTAEAVLKETIKANKRSDGMYHSYNILTLTSSGLTVSPMFLMLEGQTAVLGSGLLDAGEARELIKAMESSGLMSDERGQFFLYPVKKLKAFIERNIIPSEKAAGSKLMTRLIDDNHEGLIVKDCEGNIRFNESIASSADVSRQLRLLEADTRYANLVEAEKSLIWEIYEGVFKHKEFTGRSGIMYKYEGIGSIYWHQNAKFQVSLAETIINAAAPAAAPADTPADTSGHTGNVAALLDAYYRLRAGFGFNKPANEWGAFPLEPYSHTPYGMPAQQPGMTGQVKEDILTRMAELGVIVSDGILSFKPVMLRLSEFIREEKTFRYIDNSGSRRELPLPPRSLAFTVCGVPVVYHIKNEPAQDPAAANESGFCAKGTVSVYDTNGSFFTSDNLSLNKSISKRVFMRDSSVARIEVMF